MNDTTNLAPTDKIPTDAKNTLNFKTLPLQSKARICWGFLWRSIVVALGTAISGGIIGGILGGILGVIFQVNGSVELDSLFLIQISSGIIGLLWGCFCFYFYVGWILSSKLGNHRLLLVHAD